MSVLYTNTPTVYMNEKLAYMNGYYKVDRKHKCCILRTPAGWKYSVELSTGRLEAVEKR